MSIEKTLEDLTTAIEANTAALTAVLAARTEVTAAAAKLADKAAAAKPRAAAKDDEEKPAPVARGRGRPAKEEEDDDKPAPAKKTTKKDEDAALLESIKVGYSKFLSVADDDERAERAASVKKICKHLGVGKITEADPRDFENILDWLGDLKKGKTPVLTSGDEQDEDGDLV